VAERWKAAIKQNWFANRHYRQRQSSVSPCLDYVTTQLSAYNRPHDGRRDSASTDANYRMWPRPPWGRGRRLDAAVHATVAAPPHLSPGLSACSSDRHSPGWDGLLAHYWECTTPEKRVRSKSHYALLPSRFRLRSIVAKVFDFRLRFDYRLITTYLLTYLLTYIHINYFL